MDYKRMTKAARAAIAQETGFKGSFSISHKSECLEILIYDVIDDLYGVGPTAIKRALAEAGDGESITVRINSPGGYVHDGAAIYNLLKQHPATVNVIVDGLAASAASVIAMAGETIAVGDWAFLMIHNCSCCMYGNRHAFLDEAAIMEKIDQSQGEIFARRSGAELATVMGWLDAETWFGGQEAVDAGLADTVMTGQGEEAQARMTTAAEVVALTADVPEVVERLIEARAKTDLKSREIGKRIDALKKTIGR